MFGRRITIFTLFGFKVRIDISWLVIALLISWTLAKGTFPYYYKNLSSSMYWIMGVLGVLGLFVSIVVHELSHSLAARKFGLPMKGITLFIFGGVAEMSEEPPSPKAEFFMAIAGPLSSILFGSVLLIIYFMGSFSGWPKPIMGVLIYLSIINFILAAFNLIPAFPLDGGRVLRSILWGYKNNIQWATKIASGIGRGFGIALVIIGAVSILMGNVVGGLWWILIGMFLRGASQSSYQHMVIRDVLEGQTVRKFMTEKVIIVSPDTTINDFIENYLYKYHFKMFPVVSEDRLLGCVTLDGVKEIPLEERKDHLVHEILKVCSKKNTISPDEDAMKAVAIMRENNSSRLMVVEGEKLAGIISLKDLLHYLTLELETKV
ncbi:MAG: site-2 protease family protein [Candidatus Aminicenantes bacterium]|nr:site-2 protease family protein [Candidatus Aminicenantes bacterium]